jgi:hypothetical protein
MAHLSAEFEMEMSMHNNDDNSEFLNSFNGDELYALRHHVPIERLGMVERAIEEVRKLELLTADLTIEPNEEVERLKREGAEQREKERQNREREQAEQRAWQEEFAKAQVHRDKGNALKRAATLKVIDWCYANFHHHPPEKPGVVKGRETRLRKELARLKERLIEEKERQRVDPSKYNSIEYTRHAIMRIEYDLLPYVREHPKKMLLRDCIKRGSLFFPGSKASLEVGDIFTAIVAHVPSPFSNELLDALGIKTGRAMVEEEERMRAKEFIDQVIANPVMIATEDDLWKHRAEAERTRRKANDAARRYRQYQMGHIDKVVNSSDYVEIAGEIEWQEPEVEEVQPFRRRV